MKFIIKFIPKTTQHKPLAVAGSKCHQALGIQPKNLILLLYISSVISGKVGGVMTTLVVSVGYVWLLVVAFWGGGVQLNSLIFKLSFDRL